MLSGTSLTAFRRGPSPPLRRADPHPTKVGGLWAPRARDMINWRPLGNMLSLNEIFWRPFIYLAKGRHVSRLYPTTGPKAANRNVSHARAREAVDA
jgi:hypothetical protein